MTFDAASATLSPEAHVLVADIGGTNTRVGLAQNGSVLRQTIRRFANADFARPEAVLEAYLQAESPATPGAAVVAIAGTVLDGVAQMTNLDWTLNAQDLAHVTGAAQVRLLNDLQAQGHALDHLAKGRCRKLLAAEQNRTASTRLVVGLGTGFNACPVHRGPTGLFVPAAEAGHCHLPLFGDEERALGQSLAKGRDGLVHIEALLSGPGLARAYQYFATNARTLSPAAVIAVVDSDPAAQQALQVFIRLLARVLADLALLHLPFGGIYLVGGVSRAIAPLLGSMGFGDSLRAQVRILGLGGDFSVFLVTDDYAALSGSARLLLP